MDKTALGLLKTQIESLENSDNVKEQNILLLNTAKLLLDNINYSEAVLKLYDSMETRKIFSSFARVSESACAFFESSKDFLDPKALNGSLGQKLTSTTAQTSKISDFLESIKIKEEKLLAKEKELTVLKEEYDALQNTVDKLKKIEATVTPEIIEELKTEVTSRETKIEENNKVKGEIQQQIKEAQQVLSETEQINVSLNEEKQEIETNIFENIQQRFDYIERIFTEHSADISSIKDKIAQYINDFKNLDDEFHSYESLRCEYAAHLGENSNIVKAMNREDTKSIKEYSDRISETKTQISSLLEQYDKLIFTVADAEEKTREEIKRLQNKR